MLLRRMCLQAQCLQVRLQSVPASAVSVIARSSVASGATLLLRRLQMRAASVSLSGGMLEFILLRRGRATRSEPVLALVHGSSQRSAAHVPQIPEAL